MKRSTSISSHNHNHNHYSLCALFGDNDRKVADILLNLPNLISESESRCRIPFPWGRKRRRSGLASTPSSPPSLPDPPSSPSLQRNCQGENLKVEASSPVTPLCFSPSESDEKSKHSHKKSSKKTTREEWLKIIDELTGERELLRRELGTLQSCYNKAEALNLVLKAKKQERSFCLTKEKKTHLEITQSLNLRNELGQPPIKSLMLESQESSQLSFMVLKQPFIVDQMACGSQISVKIQHPYDQMPPFLSSSSGLDTVGILDLNVTVNKSVGMDSLQPLDLHRALTDNKAKAAEARRRRMIRMKQMKNSFGAMKAPRCR
uniref:Uncharacterized protein n=1 Tax=Davidia involucrata TaxID=16924 RepID=A0A5B7B4I8_DAVIN